MRASRVITDISDPEQPSDISPRVSKFWRQEKAQQAVEMEPSGNGQLGKNNGVSR